MMSWSRLGLSVAIAAGFAMVATAWLQSQKFYAHYRWGICVGLLGLGVTLWIAGALLRWRTGMKSSEGEETETTSAVLPLNVSYAGIMLVIFGLIVVLIVPKEEVPQPAAAVRPAQETATNRPAATITQAPRSWPKLELQGITHVDGKSSALINRRTYFPGDRIGEVELMRVERESVVLKLGEETRVLKLD
jgi:uncharacterized membrane protein YidH (DUF202 family)